ncbi:hypothetical protein EDB83DRAFT_2522421 [Lactarius deliciosus]|nr:hypothetical protein EDB83DRAFT_2522421 [Lactarius deliciosus]
MRPTTVLSFLAGSMVVLSQSPAVYAAPVPSEVNSAGAKRYCRLTICRTTELPTTATDDSSQSLVLKLVDSLIDTLTSLREDISPTNTTIPTIDLASSSPELGPATEIDVVDVVEPDALA